MERTKTVRLVSGLSAEDVRAHLARASRLCEVGQRALAFYLHEMQARGFHQETGHQSAVRYAVDRLGIPLSTAKDLLAAGRVLSELPGCDEAFCSGRIGWSKLRLLARIAVPETEKEWIAKAEALTFEDLQRAMAGLAKGDRPRKDKLGLPKVKFSLMLRLDALTYAEIARLREETGAETDEEFIRRLVRAAVAHSDADAAGHPHTTLVTHCPHGCGTTVSTSDGPVPLDDVTAAMACCDSVSERTSERLCRQV